MISSVNGLIIGISESSVVVDVGGIGLQVYVPAPTINQLRTGEKAHFFTHLVVRQDTFTLYGFESVESREIFEFLIGVNGVGPKMALTILSNLDPETIRRAIFNGQAEVFSRVPGVGKKTAQKILINLQDRIPSIEGFEPFGRYSDVDVEVVGALTTLGYSVVEAQTAVQSIPIDAPRDVEERLKIALRFFST